MKYGVQFMLRAVLCVRTAANDTLYFSVYVLCSYALFLVVNSAFSSVVML
jgi:hypothetical protein